MNEDKLLILRETLDIQTKHDCVTDELCRKLCPSDEGNM